MSQNHISHWLDTESDIVDKRIDTISEVLSVANELLLDRLKIICAEALRPLSKYAPAQSLVQQLTHDALQLTFEPSPPYYKKVTFMRVDNSSMHVFIMHWPIWKRC